MPPARHGGRGARATRRGSRRKARIATRVATVYTNVPKRLREAVLANLCTLLRPHGRSRDRAGPRVPRRRRPHGSRDARTLGPEVHPTGAVRPTLPGRRCSHQPTRAHEASAIEGLYQEQGSREAYLGAARHAELYARTKSDAVTGAGTDNAEAWQRHDPDGLPGDYERDP